MQDWADDCFKDQMAAAQARQELFPLVDGCPTCEQMPWISLFFDGTGNNKDLDGDKRKWSNVYRLQQSHLMDDARKVFTSYIPGPGTPLSPSDEGWLAALRDSGAFGGGVGLGMDARLDKGFQEFSFYLSQCQRVSRIDIAIFGFSRGATLARAWVNLVLKKCEWVDGQPHWKLDNAKHGKSAPLHIRYMGLFDTVESVGLPGKNLSPSQCMTIPNVVERCVHYVAGHELRGAFPLTSVMDGDAPPVGIEMVWPGMHSDVGGGYRPHEQGRQDTLARLPLNAMRMDAYQSGVPFLTPCELLNGTSRMRKAYDFFEYPEELKELYKHYCGFVEGSGSLDDSVRSHMALYYGWLKLRQSSEVKDVYAGVKEGREDLQKELQSELKDQQKYWHSVVFENTNRKMDADLALLKRTDLKAYLEKIRENKQMYGSAFREVTLSDRELKYWNTWVGAKLPDEKITRFFDQFVHDSRAGFTFKSGDYLVPRAILVQRSCTVKEAERSAVSG